MVTNALIRIGCILFSLIIVSGAIIYLSADSIKLINRDENQEIIMQNDNNDTDTASNFEYNVTSKGKNNKQNTSHENEIFDDYNDDDFQDDNSDNDTESEYDEDYSVDVNGVYKVILSDAPRRKPNSSNLQSSQSSSLPSDTESSAPSSIPSKPDTSSSSSTPPPSISDADIDDLVNSISKKYKIEIIVARSKNDFSSSIIKEYAGDNIKINLSLVTLSRLLNLLNTQAFENFKINKIVIVESITENESCSFLGNSMIYQYNGSLSITSLNQSVAHQMSLRVKQDMEFGKITIDLKEYNPNLFIYGQVNSNYSYNKANNIDCYFVNDNAQLSNQDDVSQIFYEIVSDQYKFVELSKLSPLYKKLKSACFVLKQKYSFLENNITIKYFS